MKTGITISVIIPVYNAQDHLRECLDSVLGQSLSNIEVVCVDDGSTDESPKILREYAGRYERIHIISQPNSGAGHARNMGISNSHGDFIAFMDADDFYPSDNTLEMLCDTAYSNNAQICGGSLLIYNNGAYEEAYPELNRGLRLDNDGWIDYKDYQFDYGYYRFIYRRDLIIDHKLAFPLYRRFQDPPFMVRAMIAAGQFYSLKDYTYVFRGGHHEVTWDDEKVQGLVEGISDDIRIAHDNDLKELLYLCIRRLTEEYHNPVYELAITGDVDMVRKLIDIENYIDNSGIEANKFTEMLNRILSARFVELTDQNREYGERIDQLVNSYSYRLGFGLTYPVRMLRRLITSRS